jgi:uncharacterized protein (TIGR03437 family)
MQRRNAWLGLLLSALAGASPAATFGTVVPIAGQASDIAIDEVRGVLYVANFTAARIDVVSLADKTVQTRMHVAPAPAALALSPDGSYLAIVHFGNAQSPDAPANAVTIADLAAGARQTYTLDNPPLGVAFGGDGMALVATTTQFLLLDPASGRTTLLTTLANVTAQSLPVAAGTAPVQAIAAEMTASGDGRYIFGLADTVRFVYDVSARNLQVIGYSATPALGPRVVSVAADGSYYAAGWGVFDRRGPLLAQFDNPSGQLAVGSHAIDMTSGTIYAQIPAAGTSGGNPAPPVLTISDADNLTLRERLSLPENLTGRSVLNAAADTLYGVSESGVLILPVGFLNQSHRVGADHEDLVFRGSFCQRGTITQTFRIIDPGGGRTSFALSSDLQGATISPSSGRTPATVQVSIDPAAFQDRRGTTIGTITITSAEAVSIPPPVRLLVNNQRPDERGAVSDVPGVLADVLADPARDRFYVLRQDRNEVLVFDGSGLYQTGTLRTGATPSRMAITFDRRNLLIGHENSQLVYVYDLDTLNPLPPIVMPAGHYPHSIAASGNAILAASRVAGTTHTIDRLDLASQKATTLPSLGVFQNSVAPDTVLAADPNGGTIMAASSDGSVLLYDATADSFTISRKLPTPLTGAFVASEGRYVAGNYWLNASLVPIATWTGTAFPSGFAFVDAGGIRLTTPPASAPSSGSIQRVDMGTGAAQLATRVADQPLSAGARSVFTRTLAPLANHNSLIALTASGFTALPWTFDAAVIPPAISSVVNAADRSTALAPGSLISVLGSNLSPTNIVTQQIPLPTAIGESCLTVNGVAVPVFFASPSQVNAQLPLYVSGSVAVTLYTPGGVSDDFTANILPVAPAIFHSGTAGPLTGIPVVVKADNQQLITPSNPIHSGDEIIIYAEGLGATTPQVPAGAASPATPLAAVALPATVSLGGAFLDVSYAGLAPGQIGVYQINARAPAKPPLGTEVPLTLTQGGVSTTVTVRVVE